MKKEVKDKTITEDSFNDAMQDIVVPNSIVNGYIRKDKKVFISGPKAAAGVLYVEKELGGVTGTLIFIPNKDGENDNNK